MSNVDSRRDGLTARHVLVVVTMSLMCFTSCCLPLSCAGVYYPSLVSYLGLSSTAALSVYQTFMSVTMIVVLPFAGKILAKADARIVLSASSALIGLAFLAMTQFDAVWQWYAAGVVQGMGLAFNLYVAIPTMINRWFAQRIGFFVGLCLAFSGIGGIVFNQLAGILIASGPEGWRTGYAVFGALCLACTLPFTALALKNKPVDVGLAPYGAGAGSADAAAPAAVRGISAAKAMRSPVFYVLALYAGLATFGSISMTMFPTFAQSLSGSFPATAAVAATVVSVASAGGLLGKIALGAICDRSAFAGLLTGSVCGIAGFLLIWLGASSVPAFLAGGFLFGVFFATATVIPPLFARRSFGNLDYSNIYSRISTAAALCSAIANPVWGLLATGDFVPFFSVALACVIGAFLAGSYVVRVSSDASSRFEEAPVGIE